MKIKWHGHSCFSIESGEYTLVVDPYTGVKGHGELDLRANAVYASHGHFDHNYFQAVRLSGYAGAEPFTVRTVHCFHDECGGAKRGENLIHIFSAEGLNAVHLGDLGHLLSDEQAEAIGPCDVLMVPVGGYYTIDGDEAFRVCEQLKPRVIIPMHYRHGKYGFDEISEAGVFLKHFPESFVKYYDEPVVELTAETEPHVAVLG